MIMLLDNNLPLKLPITINLKGFSKKQREELFKDIAKKK